MNLPQKMIDMLEEEGPELRRLLEAAYQAVEKLGLTLHPQDSPNVIAEHPQNGVNFVALWIKGRKGSRRVEGEVRVDGYIVDDLSTGMRDDIEIHKFDRDKKPLWWLLSIDSREDIDKLCLIAKRVIARTPNWGTR